MTNKERQSEESVAAAKQASAQRLVAKLEASHKAGTLKPVTPDAEPFTLALHFKPDGLHATEKHDESQTKA